MASPLDVKRRKLNDTTAKLKKPFVSPMRTRKPDSLQTQNTAQHTAAPYTPSIIAHTISPAYPAVPVATLKPRLSNPASLKHSTTPVRAKPSLTWSANKSALDREEVAARKANNALDLQIRRVQNDLDILKQAEALSNSTTDADLEALREKWRLCSQAVAEELFATVKERVQRMGGVAAWREMEKKKFERSNGLGDFAQQEEAQDDDADCEFDSQGEELPEEEQEYRRRMKAKAKQEAMEAMDPVEEPQAEDAGKAKVWQEPGRDDDVRRLSAESDLVMLTSYRPSQSI